MSKQQRYVMCITGVDRDGHVLLKGKSFAGDRMDPEQLERLLRCGLAATEEESIPSIAMHRLKADGILVSTIEDYLCGSKSLNLPSSMALRADAEEIASAVTNLSVIANPQEIMDAIGECLDRCQTDAAKSICCRGLYDAILQTDRRLNPPDPAEEDESLVNNH